MKFEHRVGRGVTRRGRIRVPDVSTPSIKGKML